MKTPKKVISLFLENTCVGITNSEFEKYMKDATRANKKQVNQLVSIYLPELYSNLSLNLYNPYKYLKTSNHLILVHSGIEYFLKYET